MYKAKRKYPFRLYLNNYFYSCIQFFKPKRITKKKKKIVKVIEDEIYRKLLEIYKGTEKVVLVKFVEAIPFSGRHFFQWKALLLVEITFFFAETIPFS